MVARRVVLNDSCRLEFNKSRIKLGRIPVYSRRLATYLTIECEIYVSVYVFVRVRVRAVYVCMYVCVCIHTFARVTHCNLRRGYKIERIEIRSDWRKNILFFYLQEYCIQRSCTSTFITRQRIFFMYHSSVDSRIFYFPRQRISFVRSSLLFYINSGRVAFHTELSHLGLIKIRNYEKTFPFPILRLVHFMSMSIDQSKCNSTSTSLDNLMITPNRLIVKNWRFTYYRL